MATAPTFEDLFETGVRQILISPTRYNAQIAREPGSDVNVALGWSAAMADELARYFQTLFAEAHLGTAALVSSESLQRWVYDRYQLTKRDEQAAVATLELRRTDTSEGFTIEAGSQFGTADGVIFRTINDVAFAQGQAGPLFVVATAEQTGVGGKVAASTIVEVISRLDDDSVTVTNPEPSAGGTDEESDSEFESRARDFFLTGRRGTLSAIQAGALDTPGVSDAQTVELLDPESGNPFFRGQTIIADPDGQANSALADRVRENLAEFRGLGVPVTVVAGVPLFVEIVISGLSFKAGVTTTNVLGAARRSILGVVNSLAPSERLEVASIFSALKAVDGLIVPDSAIEQPAGDLVPDVGRVIRTSLDRISLNEEA